MQVANQSHVQEYLTLEVYKYIHVHALTPGLLVSKSTRVVFVFYVQWTAIFTVLNIIHWVLLYYMVWYLHAHTHCVRVHVYIHSTNWIQERMTNLPVIVLWLVCLNTLLMPQTHTCARMYIVLSNMWVPTHVQRCVLQLPMEQYSTYAYLERERDIEFPQR